MTKEQLQRSRLFALFDKMVEQEKVSILIQKIIDALFYNDDEIILSELNVKKLHNFATDQQKVRTSESETATLLRALNVIAAKLKLEEK